MFDRWWASGQVLEVYRGGRVPGTPAYQALWESVRAIHYKALVDVFGADSAEVSRALRETLTSPFASPVPAPVSPSPHPASRSELGAASKP